MRMRMNAMVMGEFAMIMGMFAMIMGNIPMKKSFFPIFMANFPMKMGEFPIKMAISPMKMANPAMMMGMVAMSIAGLAMSMYPVLFFSICIHFNFFNLLIKIEADTKAKATTGITIGECGAIETIVVGCRKLTVCIQNIVGK